MTEESDKKDYEMYLLLNKVMTFSQWKGVRKQSQETRTQWVERERQLAKEQEKLHKRYEEEDKKERERKGR